MTRRAMGTPMMISWLVARGEAFVGMHCAPMEKYSPKPAMDITALYATEPPRSGKARMKLNVHSNHTGVRRQKLSALAISFFFRLETNRNDSESATVG